MIINDVRRAKRRRKNVLKSHRRQKRKNRKETLINVLSTVQSIEGWIRAHSLGALEPWSLQVPSANDPCFPSTSVTQGQVKWDAFYIIILFLSKWWKMSMANDGNSRILILILSWNWRVCGYVFVFWMSVHLLLNYNIHVTKHTWRNYAKWNTGRKICQMNDPLH